MKRAHQILIAILAVQVILGVIVFWPRSAQTAEAQPLFADLKTEDVVTLSIMDADGKSTTLQKQTGEWVLPDAGNFPADAARITPVLADIVGLTTGRLVTRTDASHKQLQVSPSDFQRRIEIGTTDGQTYALYLGSSPSYGSTHVRRADRNETYLTSDLTVWDVNVTPTSWINTSYVSIPTDEVAQMTLVNSQGAFVFTKDDDGVWSMEGLALDETADEVQIGAAVRQAASVVLTSPLGREERAAYGMSQPSATTTLQTPDKVITLTLGAQDPTDSTWVAKSSESPYYVRISSYAGEQLANKSRDDFLKAPPTPEP